MAEGLLIGSVIYILIFAGALFGTNTLKGDRNRALTSGIICFLLLALPWSLFSFTILSLTDPTPGHYSGWEIYGEILIVNVICALESGFLGFSMYRRRKSLILTSIILLAILIIGVFSYIYHMFKPSF